MFNTIKQWFYRITKSNDAPNVEIEPLGAIPTDHPTVVSDQSKVPSDASSTSQQKNKHGHQFTHSVQDGYGVCKCGARENTDAATTRCPLAGKKRKQRKRYRGKKPKAQS